MALVNQLININLFNYSICVVYSMYVLAMEHNFAHTCIRYNDTMATGEFMGFMKVVSCHM